MKDLSRAAADLEKISQDPAIGAADDMARAFEAAGDRIAAALEKAAQSGEMSFSALAESAAQSLARIAIEDLLIGPMQSALSGLLGSSGPAAAAPNITLNLQGVSDAAGLSRSGGQIAGALARVVGMGQGYI